MITTFDVRWACDVLRPVYDASGGQDGRVSIEVDPRMAQDAAYRQRVLPSGIKARVSVEAAVSQGWREIVGDAGEIVALDHFGASAAHTVLYEQFGFTPDRVVAAAHASLERVGLITGSKTGN